MNGLLHPPGHVNSPGPCSRGVNSSRRRRQFFYNRAGISKLYFRCFKNATGSSSAPRAVPELRIELEATIFHAGGPEIG